MAKQTFVCFSHYIATIRGAHTLCFPGVRGLGIVEILDSYIQPLTLCGAALERSASRSTFVTLLHLAEWKEIATSHAKRESGKSEINPAASEKCGVGLGRGAVQDPTSRASSFRTIVFETHCRQNHWQNRALLGVHTHFTCLG